MRFRDYAPWRLRQIEAANTDRSEEAYQHRILLCAAEWADEMEALLDDGVSIGEAARRVSASKDLASPIFQGAAEAIIDCWSFGEEFAGWYREQI